MMNEPCNYHLEKEIQRLNPICEVLLEVNLVQQKLSVLEKDKRISEVLQKFPFVRSFIDVSGPDETLMIYSLIVLGQGEHIFQHLDSIDNPKKWLKNLVKSLLPVETFYEPLGGVVGYHLAVLEQMCMNENTKQDETKNVVYSKPPEKDITEETPEILKTVRIGIERLPEMAEIYPVGGAGDRLNLLDEESGQPLPAAQLHFCGRTLLEGLIRDLQAKEYLYYKLIGMQMMTPIVMMTSEEKDNHQHITNICKENHWFGRDQDNFFLFSQPLVPVINIKGEWVLNKSLHLVLKPGGHGVIWKLAADSGGFAWLKARGRSKLLVRQINNPIAGTDYGLLAFTGVGLLNNKIFGFASCNRVLNTAEGMDILIQKKHDHQYEYGISNIEYTDFKNKGVKDVPVKAGSQFSAFPSNTNILFADLKAIEEVAEKHPLPGVLINLKSRFACLSRDGQIQELPGGRLESTMQNIADEMLDTFDHPLKEDELHNLSTYLTYNDRHKTISVTKRSYVKGQSLLETPEGCFYDLLKNYYDLLSNHCLVKMEPLGEMEHYLQKELPFFVLLHPALGPLYSIIAQKIHGGTFGKGAELQLEIAEIELDNLHLEGSLIVKAKALLGDFDKQGIIQYGENTGKCILKNVTVKNRGIDQKAENRYWKNQVTRHESLNILIHGNGEFFAENVNFIGNERIEVPSGHRVTAYAEGNKIRYKREQISSPTWYWKYSFDEANKILLKKHG